MMMPPLRYAEQRCAARHDARRYADVLCAAARRLDALMSLYGAATSRILCLPRTRSASANAHVVIFTS